MKNKINIPIPEFKAFMNNVTKVIAVTAKKHSVDRWKDQGYYIENTGSFKPWKARKRETRQSRGKAILVDTGDLRLSVKGRAVSKTRAIVQSALPYSAKHNEGLGSMPKRQFLNDNLILGKELEKSVTLLMKRKGL